MRTRVRTRSTPLSIWILRSLSGRSRKRTPPRRKSRVEASQRSRDAAKLENVKFTSNGQSGAAKNHALPSARVPCAERQIASHPWIRGVGGSYLPVPGGG